MCSSWGPYFELTEPRAQGTGRDECVDACLGHARKKRRDSSTLTIRDVNLPWFGGVGSDSQPNGNKCEAENAADCSTAD